MATRYSDKTKQEIVDFVKKFDMEHGRGGQSAAKKQFKINPISIKKWCVEQGYEGGAPKKKKSARGSSTAQKSNNAGAKPVRTASTVAPSFTARSAGGPVKANSTTAILVKMASLSEKIEELQSEFDTLKQSL